MAKHDVIQKGGVGINPRPNTPCPFPKALGYVGEDSAKSPPQGVKSAITKRVKSTIMIEAEIDEAVGGLKRIQREARKALRLVRKFGQALKDLE